MDVLNGLLLSVVEVSISTGIIILILLLAAPFLKKRYASEWMYFIWIGLAVRLIIPFHFSLPVRPIEVTVPVQVPAYAALSAAEGAAPIVFRLEEKAVGVTVMDVAAMIWLAVSVGIILTHIGSYIRFRACIVKKGTYVEGGVIPGKLSALKKELGIRKSIPVIRYRDAASPMIVGFFRPLLVIPERMYSEEELFFVLKHELIHLKRHDILFKFLFMAARAVHWFNPAVALMGREADIEMELSCDEKVVFGMPYAERRAYTETLIASVGGGLKKTSRLTTQFYGGKRIMKKRFENILRQYAGRRGYLLLAAVICMTLAAGTMTGCAVIQTEFAEDSGRQTDTDGTETPPGEREDAGASAEEQKGGAAPGAEIVPSGQDPVQNGQAGQQAQGEQQQSNPGQTGAQNSGGRVPLSAEALEVSDVANKFARAYFEGDREEIQKYLADSYDEEIEVYTDADPKLSGMIGIKGVEDIEEAEIGDTLSVSMECSMAEAGEGFLYLTLEMVKQEDGWKIDFYGLEM